MADRKQLFLAIFLLLAIGLSTLFGLQKAFEYKTLPAAASNEPDAFMENIVAKRMGPDGKLANELRSPRLDHYAKDNSTHLATPSLILYSKHPGQKPWHITALHGRAYKGTEWIELWDTVKGHRSAGRHAAITFLTDAATVFPDRKYAITDRHVQATQGALVVTGVGMEADLESQQIELLSQVKSSYVPKT